MKKIVAMLLLVTMLMGVVSLSGCKSNPTGGAGSPNGEFKGETNFDVPEGGFKTSESVKITFGHTMGAASQAILDKYIKEFNKILTILFAHFLFFFLYGFPHGKSLFRSGSLWRITKYMRMSSNHFLSQSIHHISYGKTSFFLRYLRMKKNLQKYISKLFT